MTCCDNPAGYSPDRVSLEGGWKGRGGEDHEKNNSFFIRKDATEAGADGETIIIKARACRVISYYMRPSTTSA